MHQLLLCPVRVPQPRPGLPGSTILMAVLLALVWPITPCRAQDARRLFEAAGAGDIDAVRRLVPEVADLDEPVRFGLTPYQWARIHGHAEVMDHLAGMGADTAAIPPPATEIVDSILVAIVRPDGPGAAVRVSRAGAILFEKGYGLADIEHGVPAAPRTPFRIGSITKGFTAAAILRLEQEGRLSVEDPLARFIPEFPRGDEVTLEHLLTHTSGIRDHTEDPAFLAAMERLLPPETLLATIASAPFEGDPGDRFRYSNSGYFLLARVIERVSGVSYTEFLTGNVIRPAGLNSTGVRQGAEVVEGEARGYRWVGGRPRLVPTWDASRIRGAGGMYSTAEDLDRWIDALFAGSVIDRERVRAMVTPGATVRDDPDSTKTEGYGYGWGIGSLRGLPWIFHSGGADGLATYVARVPPEDFNVVLLTNARPAVPGMNVEALAPLIAQAFLSDRMELRRAPRIVQVSPDVYDAYVGRYDYGIGILTVRRDGDRLLAQLTGRLELELFPVAEDEFVFDWSVIDARVRFVTDEAGRVVRAIHRQGGEIIDAPRLP
jgi:CubicO group peptidase (beta-lactamase class C family)